MTTYTVNTSLCETFGLEIITIDDSDPITIPVASWNDFGGMTGLKHTTETRAKMSAAHKGKQVSAETREKLRQNSIGRPQTPGRTAAINALNSKPRSKESNIKRSETLRGKPQKTMQCIHCGLIGSNGNITRWHGINCKEYKLPVLSNHD